MKPSGGYELVYERSFVYSQLCETAKNNRALFSKYDLGGAEELQFSDCCQRGTITAKCLGTCYTIKGRSVKPSTLQITCANFCEQGTIGGPIAVPNEPTCCLIKLAPRHPAIDFIIYKSDGGVQTRVVYFIQVSSSTYQHRQKKFGSVTEPYSDLEDKSPYEFYKKMFNMTSSEVYYIYSTPSPLPSNADFTRCKADKNRVYFHQLGH